MTVQLEFLESDLRAESGASPGRGQRAHVDWFRIGDDLAGEAWKVSVAWLAASREVVRAASAYPTSPLVILRPIPRK